MPDIGETLRETRMRRHIDMSEVEAATKIRAKYLRALENEEWDLLPGPTFVKTFLRTYAEYLGLDPRTLVEEYRQRYERPTMHELSPLGGLGGQRRRRGPPPLLGPGLGLLLGVVLLVGFLYVLGRLGEQKNEGAAPPRRTGTGTAAKKARKHRRQKAATPTQVSLRLTATGTVYVCLVDANGNKVIDGSTLTAGQTTRTYRSKRFRANFGNGAIRMRVNGHSYQAAGSANPVGYEMRPGRKPKPLAESVRVKLCA
jgi:transcriptional regulator with XRE-family HTH domain